MAAVPHCRTHENVINLMLRAAGVSGDRMSKWVDRRRPLRAAALVLASTMALAMTPADAKHASPQGDSDADSQTSPAPADVPPAGHGTVITGQFVESHDLLSDSGDLSKGVRAGLEWSHNFTIVLSGKNHVSERWNNVRGSRGIAIAPEGSKHRGAHLVSRTGENSVTIGDATGRAVWHVLGEKKLQRIFPGQHFLLIMTIDVGADNACSLDVKYLRQEGFTTIEMSDSTGLMSRFSLPRVESQSCTIQ